MPAQHKHVLIVGGGVAAIEALLALGELAGHQAKITLLTPQREFLYRPVTVAEPFERAAARSYDLATLVESRGATLVSDAMDRVDPGEQLVHTTSGRRLAYDILLIAIGAVQKAGVPGSLGFGGRSDVPALREVLEDLVSGKARSVVFTLPSGRVWPLPAYELALLTAAHLREQGCGPRQLTLLTPEEEPLELFGPEAAKAIEPALRAYGIVVRTSSRPASVHGRALKLVGGGEMYADRVISLPQLEGPSVPGLPCDDHGFIPVDSHGHVEHCDHVYAAGDATSFPLKQGGLAAQQADAAAESIAAELGVAITPKPFSPVLRGLLMTGGAPLYLRSEPQRLTRPKTVAIEATPLRRSTREASAAAGQPLWWPPAKIAGRYLGPFLATARPERLGEEPLIDRIAVPGPPLSEADYHDALDLALLLADCDARWGDYGMALNALDAAEALGGALPPEYEAKRRSWLTDARMASR